MRLSSLKLSGFKSFADSTVLHFKDSRTAVVGPNGCGKSNVIDAIRWVMGESSARQLRGGSMQDVIFTGTVKRKPVSLASVELRFDNTYGKLGGAYNAYTELAVRRQVNRDGKSEYFLNGTRCRRRDITDIFLGTGLGPRSYSIIEQGMINRLVDAKPEEMRVFIEEAAGVSRYQARRRETMQHLEHTTQNLSRLDDIAAELNGQLKTLKRQAEAALQYKELEKNIRTIKLEVLSFQIERSTRLQQEYTVQLNTLGEQFKLVRSDLSTQENNLASTNELFQRLIQQSSPLQTEWQQAEKKLAEYQVTLQQKKNLLSQNQTTFEQLTTQRKQLKERIQLSDVHIENLITQLDEQTESFTVSELRTQQKNVELEQLQFQYKEVKLQFDTAKQQVEQYQQKKMQMLAQSEQLTKNISRIEQHKQTLLDQLKALTAQTNPEQVINLQDETSQHQQRITAIDLEITQLQSQLEQTNTQHQQFTQHLANLKSNKTVLEAEHKNLTQLLVKASSQTAQSQLIHQLTLTLQAKPYAHLIEKLLSKWLSADVVTAQFQPEYARQLKLSDQACQKNRLDLPCLATWIEGPESSLWQHVYMTETLTQALALQTTLSAHETLLSLDGYHVGTDWLIGLHYDDASQAAQGALSHRIRLEEIEKDLQTIQVEIDNIQIELQQVSDNKQQYQISLNTKKDVLKQVKQALQQFEIQLAKIESTTQAVEFQKQQLESQLQQIELQFEEDAMQKDDLEIDLHALNLKLEQVLPNFKTLQFQTDELAEQVATNQEQLKQIHHEFELLNRQKTQTQQQLELLEKDLSFLKMQLQQTNEQIEQAQQFIEPIQLELPALETQFDEQQKITTKLKKTWDEWQLELNQVQARQQTLTTERQIQQQQDEKLRQQLEEVRLSWQKVKTDLQHYSDQLSEMNAELISGLELDLTAHQKQLEKYQQQFDKLGAVNLAASEEYQEVSERAEKLNHQMDDLKKTVAQLQAAMKSIDQETRKLFMDTFDQINHELKNLFPKIFNGGEASLSLEDGWQSGVKLMARPPGKKNSSLALLSGGEKALTALALVFAIFRLNPAPFCVLDEVDAPLDDANVGRFCNLVKELSEQVQFIYITHNKLAMTMATDLLGVTMPEPGTSKLVTVNLEQAKEYGLVAES